MGFNTTINIINDGFDQLEKHPEEFIAKIRRNMLNGGTFGVGNHGNVVEVMPAQHADVFCLYMVQGNSIINLSPYSSDTLTFVHHCPNLTKDFIDQARRNLDQLEEVINEELDE